MTRFDKATKHVFIGDYGGNITMLKLSCDSFQHVTSFKGHSESVRCLAWDSNKSVLFSGSFDQTIIAWDIGGQKGTAYELQGHK